MLMVAWCAFGGRRLGCFVGDRQESAPPPPTLHPTERAAAAAAAAAAAGVSSQLFIRDDGPRGRPPPLRRQFSYTIEPAAAQACPCPKI